MHSHTDQSSRRESCTEIVGLEYTVGLEHTSQGRSRSVTLRRPASVVEMLACPLFLNLPTETRLWTCNFKSNERERNRNGAGGRRDQVQLSARNMRICNSGSSKGGTARETGDWVFLPASIHLPVPSSPARDPSPDSSHETVSYPVAAS
jgi:hypothetical protein